MKSGFLWAGALAFLSLASCKKDKSSTAPVTPPVDTTATQPTTDDLVKDTALGYSRDIYLWNTQIPDTFDARAYADPNAIMEGIRRYSTEPGFTDPVDRFSFGMKQVDWDNTSNGIAQDYGLNIFFKEDGDLRVRMVEPLSPAGLAGVRRGWQIVKIDGSTDISVNNADYIVNHIYYATSGNISFKKPNGDVVDIDLSAATYQETPVYMDSVYTVGAKKVGYLVYTSFLGDSTAVVNRLTQVFSRFVTAGVTDVVVDIRYNGGGYVSLSQKLADFLVKSSANGQTMMTQKYNTNYTDYNETAKFEKAGALNIDNVYFIVDEYTASASELLINNLKPYMNVKLVGGTTYGKPVGFFPIPAGDWYIFPVSFRSTNSNGEGNYFSGFTPDKEVVDGIDKDFGDVTESRLASVLTYINTGSFGFAPKGTALSSRLSERFSPFSQKFAGKKFVGAIGAGKTRAATR